MATTNQRNNIWNLYQELGTIDLMVAVIQVQTEKKSMITELSPTTINWSEQPYVIRNQEEGKPKRQKNRTEQTDDASMQPNIQDFI